MNQNLILTQEGELIKGRVVTRLAVLKLHLYLYPASIGFQKRGILEIIFVKRSYSISHLLFFSNSQTQNILSIFVVLDLLQTLNVKISKSQNKARE